MIPASIALYFVSAAVLGAAGRRWPRLIPAAALAPYALQIGVVWGSWGDGGDPVAFRWIPALELELRFASGDLNLLLSAVVAGIGGLIAGYSLSYFSAPAARARFLALMALFSGGMAGIVASDDLFGLFVFWEVTTVASYLLIGFKDEDGAARASALQAVLVTTVGGLAMLAGFVLLADQSGTTAISEIVADPPRSTTATVALSLVLLGAFTKSAQVPFHFWLPGAMAAPTPASAYLHSATMVKAGIVLLLFLAPGFGQEALWTGAVTTVGLLTMVTGAVAAMRRNDLKLLLAHGTVSQLGFIVALIGLGLTGAALAVLVAHALFKACLFLVVGVVDTATGTRDIRHLGDLARAMPVVAGAAAVAAISMAGLPPVVGFVTKEAAIDGLIAAGRWFPLAVIASASVLTVAYSARFWFGAFAAKPGGPGPSQSPSPVSGGLVLAPIVLAALSILLGLAPDPLESTVASSLGEKTKLVLWPGLKLAVFVSLGIILAGAALHTTWPRWEQSALLRRFPARRRSVAEGAYAAAVRYLNVVADRVTGIVQNGSLPIYLAVVLCAVLAVPAVSWAVGFREEIGLRVANSPAEVGLVVVTVAGALGAAVAQRRMAAVLLLGVVGYAVAGIYVVFGAPDLALTQLLVETLTIALFALVLVRLPRRFGRDPRSLARSVRVAVAGAVGGFVFTAALLASSIEHDRTIADRYVELAPEAGGRNVVNIVLTNFRAIDTLGEITVLAAAAIGISVLVRQARRRPGTEGARR